jgi:AraC-like DNA-binding protein
MSDFSFPGESHDFWELVCVDRGEIDALAGERRLTLKKGNILFHKPNEFHNVLTNGKVSPSLVVIGFVCHSPAIKSFEDQLMSVQDTEKELLAQIIVEARNTFSGRLDDPYQEELIFNSEPLTFGSAQLISHYLEQLIIHLYRRYFSYSLPVRSSRFLAEASSGNDTYNRIVRYMEEHLGERMTIDRICRDNLVGRSQLQKLFRDTKGCGVIEFFSMMKIDTAKQMIRDNQLNFTQIADRLGYSSIHYFSRQFKQITTMTPSEYATSIRLLSEKP